MLTTLVVPLRSVVRSRLRIFFAVRSAPPGCFGNPQSVHDPASPHPRHSPIRTTAARHRMTRSELLPLRILTRVRDGRDTGDSKHTYEKDSAWPDCVADRAGRR